jgi:hypothetical protein
MPKYFYEKSMPISLPSQPLGVVERFEGGFPAQAGLGLWVKRLFEFLCLD